MLATFLILALILEILVGYYLIEKATKFVEKVDPGFFVYLILALGVSAGIVVTFFGAAFAVITQ